MWIDQALFSFGLSKLFYTSIVKNLTRPVVSMVNEKSKVQGYVGVELPSDVLALVKFDLEWCLIILIFALESFLAFSRRTSICSNF